MGITGRLSLSVAGSSDVTLTAAQCRNDVLNFTGILTGDIDVIVPNGPQEWTVTNNTTGSFSLTVKTAAGTGVVITQGNVHQVLADGTNVVNTATPAGVVSAASVSITDAGTYYTGTDVEAALQEIGADIAALGGGGGVELKGLTFTSETGSTADSDPGAGLFKWNNGTQGSATFLYFDDVTADAVNLDTFYTSLGSTGFIYLQQGDDSTKWQLWKWTSAPTDGTGYWKFPVTLQASGGSMADAETVYADFTGAGGGGFSGPGSSTDNTLPRFDGTGGATLQGSGIVVDDDDSIHGYKAKRNAQTGTTYTLVAGDSGKVVELTNASAITLTLPDSLAEGFNCTLVQGGAGQVTLSAAGGATLRNRQSHAKIAGQWGVVALHVRGNSGGSAAEYVFGGDTAS
jgi:hypothetical protein